VGGAAARGAGQSVLGGRMINGELHGVAMEDEEVSTLFVRNLVQSVMENAVLAQFSAFGAVDGINLHRKAHCTAHVRFTTRDDAAQAKAALHGRVVGALSLDRPLLVEWAASQMMQPPVAFATDPAQNAPSANHVQSQQHFANSDRVLAARSEGFEQRAKEGFDEGGKESEPPAPSRNPVNASLMDTPLSTFAASSAGFGSGAQEICRHFQRTGTCMYGLECRHTHVRPDVQQGHVLGHVQRRTGGTGQQPELCRHFHRTGRCMYGAECRHIHAQSTRAGLPLPGAEAGIIGLVPAISSSSSRPAPPRRPSRTNGGYDVEVCRHFQRTGTCMYGFDCRHIHPAPGQS